MLKHYVMKMCGAMVVKFQILLTLALDGHEW
jgi:hypothetical protein